MKTILYLHGFISSPASRKVVMRGGDHSFASFSEFVPDIVAWARDRHDSRAGAAS